MYIKNKNTRFMPYKVNIKKEKTRKTTTDSIQKTKSKN